MRNLKNQKALVIALLSIVFSAHALAQETNRSSAPQRRESQRRYSEIRLDKSRKTISNKVGQTKGSKPVPFNLINLDVVGLVVKEEKLNIDWGKGKVLVTAVVENPSVFTSKSAYLVAQVVHLTVKPKEKMTNSLDFWNLEVKQAEGVAVPPVAAGKSVTLEIDLTGKWDALGLFVPPGAVQGLRCVLLTSLPS